MTETKKVRKKWPIVVLIVAAAAAEGAATAGLIPAAVSDLLRAVGAAVAGL